MAIVRKLALGFRTLALSILLLAFLLQSFSTKQATDSFFSRAHGLVIATLGSAWVVGRDTTGGGDCIGANLADSVGGILLSCCLLFGGIALDLDMM